MSQPGTSVPIKTTLVDINNCIGCRACQVACKQWNDRDGEATELQDDLGFQNPATLSAKTYTLISFHELVNEASEGGVDFAFAMRRCLHCLEPACASACPTTALSRREDGPVIYDPALCIGCRYCMLACPWDVPTADWNTLKPKIHKCTHCADRTDQPLPQVRNEQALDDGERTRFLETIATPACVKACPADALRFGEREEMLAEARKRIAARPDRYVDHIYGEHEAGGTSVLYLSRVPFAKLGFPELGPEPYPARSAIALGAVPPAVMALGALLGAAFTFFKRRASAVAADEHHHEFAPVPEKVLTPANALLLILMAVGAIAFVARFVLGLGGSTHLSDTFPWGLWIVFDLVWIAVAAGAFASAGLIYVFRRKDLYDLGRAAVLIGLLSYSFVTVTLVADLGLPWQSYQLALQAPEHSAMFEVSWCVGLYVTILLMEFLPVVFERTGHRRAMEAWRRWSGAWVVFAVTLFVYMLSRSVVYAAITAAIFATLAWLFRPREGHFEPVLLAIAAVTLSAMHQSSLGSLFLLMPKQLAPQWWSPAMPISFFISSIAAGTSMVILIEMWIARVWRRAVPVKALASMGAIAFWALLAYLVFRIGDMAMRHQLSGAFRGRLGALFATEIVLGGIVPLILLSRSSLRAQPRLLAAGALLAVCGVAFNRVNAVVLAMTLDGPMPNVAPQAYSPSFVEWAVSIGLIAATIFLFALGVRLFPVFPKREAHAG